MKISRRLNIFIVALILLWIGSVSYAGEMAYGWQLMTEDEITEHQNKMRSFKTEEEREAYRFEHHKRMQERANEQGITLPDTPQQRGKGMGPGGGMGGGRNP